MKKGRPKKLKKEREKNSIRTNLNDSDYDAVEKRMKEKRCVSQAAYLRDLILQDVYGATT